MTLFKTDDPCQHNTALIPDEVGKLPMPVEFVDIVEFPELFVGLVGPIGVDLEFVQSMIADSLKAFGYSSELMKITKLMNSFPASFNLDADNLISVYDKKIRHANEIRAKYETNNILAAIVVAAIKDHREQFFKTSKVTIDDLKGFKNAYLIRQLKTPEEVKLLRSVYGKQFMLISVYTSSRLREEYLTSETRIRSKGTVEENEARREAKALIERDAKEDMKFGQNVSDTFFQGDVFIDLGDKHAAKETLERFLNALFGSNEVTPTHDEYGMYLAKSASLRSSDLSRQVGAAIFSPNGEVVSLGSNEVPKGGGGTYWTDDIVDQRDMQIGYDPNELGKTELLSDLITRLFDAKHLSIEMIKTGSPQNVINSLLGNKEDDRFRKSKIMNVIEFGRIIHAEMSAITDAARNGNAVRGSTLFSTAFPCHLCAKHIVSSGVKRVVYLEPYPKSYALRLHGDSITVDSEASPNKVSFEPFMGISPYRYRDLFEKGKRKDGLGKAKRWVDDPHRPMLDIIFPPYFEAEGIVKLKLADLVTRINEKTENGVVVAESTENEAIQKERENTPDPMN